ncbi:hypothetical protein HYX00_01895 [Candidatus Woesearchaeota archaeon]|nr:hypothetical protein [Candidatus Woesearchaeota archaeon]
MNTLNELVLAGLLGGVGGLTRGVCRDSEGIGLEKEDTLELLGYYCNNCHDYWCVYRHSVQF